MFALKVSSNASRHFWLRKREQRNERTRLPPWVVIKIRSICWFKLAKSWNLIISTTRQVSCKMICLRCSATQSLTYSICTAFRTMTDSCRRVSSNWSMRWMSVARTTACGSAWTTLCWWRPEAKSGRLVSPCCKSSITSSTRWENASSWSWTIQFPSSRSFLRMKTKESN